MPPTRRACGSGIAACALACAVLAGCSFEPVVRKAVPERVRREPLTLVRSLDAIGSAVLVEQASADGAGPTRSVFLWHEGALCELPADYPEVLSPLPRPVGRSGTHTRFYLPLAQRAPEGEDAAFVLADEHCRLRGPFPPIAPKTARVLVSARDQRGILFAKDGAGHMLAFDPYAADAPVTIASAVSRFVPVHGDGTGARDAAWLLEGGRVTLRDATGALLAARGGAVTELSVRHDEAELAFVDDGVLYRAAAPGFGPTRVADEACSVHFVGKDLAAFAPCSGCSCSTPTTRSPRATTRACWGRSGSASSSSRTSRERTHSQPCWRGAATARPCACRPRYVPIAPTCWAMAA